MEPVVGVVGIQPLAWPLDALLGDLMVSMALISVAMPGLTLTVVAWMTVPESFSNVVSLMVLAFLLVNILWMCVTAMQTALLRFNVQRHVLLTVVAVAVSSSTPASVVYHAQLLLMWVIALNHVRRTRLVTLLECPMQHV
jgi:hypothetical protein